MMKYGILSVNITHPHNPYQFSKAWEDGSAIALVLLV